MAWQPVARYTNLEMWSEKHKYKCNSQQIRWPNNIQIQIGTNTNLEMWSEKHKYKYNSQQIRLPYKIQIQIRTNTNLTDTDTIQSKSGFSKYTNTNQQVQILRVQKQDTITPKCEAQTIQNWGLNKIVAKKLSLHWWLWIVMAMTTILALKISKV